MSEIKRTSRKNTIPKSLRAGEANSPPRYNTEISALLDSVRGSEERFRSLAENSSDAIISVNSNGDIIFWNKKAETIFGYASKEAIGKSITCIIPERFREKHRLQMNRLTSADRPNANSRTIELAGMRRDKTEFFMELSVSQWSISGEMFFTGVVRDTTLSRQVEDELREHRDHLDLMVKERTAELIKLNRDLRAEIMRRIRMEKELMESQRFVNRITDATPNIIYLYDLLENRLVYINDRVRDVLGYSPEGIRRMKLSELTTPAAREVFKLRKQRFRESQDGDIIESEYQMKNARGEYRWFYSRDVLFKKTDNGQPKLILGMAQDISERKIAEEEIRNSRQQLRKLLAHQRSVREDERTRISREIHDELGQSLTALKMDLYWVARRLNRDQKQLLEKTQIMSRIIDMTIKTVKRISAELRPGMLDDLGLAAALEWQADDFQKRTGINCKLTVIPEYIMLDRDVSTAIFRIFQETLTNVARHAKAKDVRINLERNDNEVMLRVWDNGKGITKKQAASPKSIGLIGMRERVDFLGGRLDITGRKNKGTTVVVHIPVN